MSAHDSLEAELEVVAPDFPSLVPLAAAYRAASSSSPSILGAKSRALQDIRTEAASLAGEIEAELENLPMDVIDCQVDKNEARAEAVRISFAISNLPNNQDDTETETEVVAGSGTRSGLRLGTQSGPDRRYDSYAKALRDARERTRQAEAKTQNLTARQEKLKEEQRRLVRLLNAVDAEDRALSAQSCCSIL